MALFVPKWAGAAFTFTAYDTKGKLLSFANPALIAGTCPSGKTCSSNGSGAAYQGAKYKYTNVITIDGVRIDAIVSVDSIVNATLNTFDDPTPNPTGSPRAKNGVYTTSFGWVVSEAAVFAPQITSSNRSADAYVKFTINFVDSSGNPVVLKNVYNNTLDAESVEYNSYGGFQSYKVAADNATNAKRIIATPGLNGNIRFSSSDCTGDMGLYIKDQSRVQTKFDTITSLTITNGQFANGTVPKIGGGVSTCTNSSIRYYGAIFVQDEFIDTPGTTIEYTAPTVELLTTNDTTPTLSGTIGGVVSTASPKGSPLVAGDTFTVNVGGVTYTAGDGKLSTSGVNWTLNIPTALTPGTIYEVTATRGVLVDQTNNELVISPVCTSPLMLNAAGTACVTKGANDVTLCHSGNGINYTKIAIPSSGLNGHEAHEHDVEADAITGKCPGLPPKDKACTAVGQPLPAGADTDGKKVTICHFPPGNVANVQIISISVNALDVHVGHHYDTIWENGKSCPTSIDDCDPPPAETNTPTVDFQTTRNNLPILTGTIGLSPATSGTTFTVLVNGKTYSYSPNGNSSNTGGSVVITGTTWSLATTTAIPAGMYNVIATRIEKTGTGNNAVTVTTTDTTTNELTILPPCTASQGVVNGVCTDLPTVTINEIDGKTYDGVHAVSTSNTKPVIKGTVGSLPLGATEDFYVFVNGVKYTKGDGKLSVPDNMNWTLTIPTTLPLGTYDIIADRDDGLGDITYDEMIITPQIPTVVSQITADTTPVVTGTVGSSPLSANETFTILVNGVLYNNGDGKLSASGTNWTLNISAPLTAGTTYDVTATRAGSAIDATSGELIIVKEPTVETQTTSNTKPTIKGTVGDHVLNTIGGIDEAFSVTVNGVTYTKTSGLVISGLTWTLAIPTALPVGVYNVDALRDGQLLDKTSGELTITGTNPTVTRLQTNDTTPTIMGTFGTTDLGANETFTVTVNGVVYHKGDGNLVTLSSSWSLTIPEANALAIGTYEVAALRNNEFPDLSNNELEIAIASPTVEDKTVREKQPIALKGTVGDVELGNSETFTVAVNNKTYAKGSASLVISGLNWTLNIPTADLDSILAVNSPYSIVATRAGTLTGTGTLTVEALKPPTVEKQTTFDTTPVIKGTVGEIELETTEVFTVAVNGKTYTKGTDANLVVSGLNWTLNILAGSEIAGRVQPYDVTAKRDTLEDLTSGELTIQPCALPKVVNAAGDACIDPIPTVNPITPISTNLTAAPTITGTVGEVVLGSSETFSVTIGTTPPQVYNKGDSALTISPAMTTWTLKIPDNKAIAPGTYEVEAARNTTAKDTTHNELIINLVCLTDEVNVNGVCVKSATLPTVDALSTEDRTPVLTGTVGGTQLATSEPFTVEVAGTVYSRASGAVSVTGTAWSLQIETPILPNTYEVVATRNDTMTDATSNELTITDCPAPKIIKNGDCVTASTTPTVDQSSPQDINNLKIEVKGTVGDTVLGEDSFSVTIHNSEHNIPCALVVTGTAWTCTLSKPYYVGIFDVDAVREGITDTTSGELEITNNIAICENGVDKTIPKASWDGGVNQDLGHCSKQAGDDDLPTKEDALPVQPNSKVDEAVKVTGLEYCNDGGVKSDADTNGATVKRATIVNATTEGGTADLLTYITRVKYGDKLRAVGTVDISNATLTSANRAIGVLLTGVTLDDVYIDTDVDYIDANGNPISGGTHIPLLGGTTKSTSTKSDGSTTPATITSGVIVAGTDSASGNPVRGSITSAHFAGDVTNATTVLTKGRRIRGKLVNATIENARITTVSPVTIVDAGIIRAGTLEQGSTSPVSAFGTVLGATLTDMTLTNSNHCFSSGTVGNKGQLNWKEVVK